MVVSMPSPFQERTKTSSWKPHPVTGKTGLMRISLYITWNQQRLPYILKHLSLQTTHFPTHQLNFVWTARGLDYHDQWEFMVQFKTEEFPKSPKLLRLTPESPVITRLKKYMSSTRIGQHMRNKRHCMYFSENPLKSSGFSSLDDCHHISTLNSMPLNTVTDLNIPTTPTSTILKTMNDIIIPSTVTPTIPQLQSRILRRKLI